MIKIVDKIEEVLDFTWEFSQNDLHASYPRKKSLEEARADIEKAINAANQNVIAKRN